MARIGKATDKEYLEHWERYRQSFRDATPVDLNETTPQRMKRVARLEADPEEWFRYYFPQVSTRQPHDGCSRIRNGSRSERGAVSWRSRRAR